MHSLVKPAVAVTIEPQDITHAEGLYAALQDRRIYSFLDQEPPSSVEGLRERIARLSKGAPTSVNDHRAPVLAG